MPQSLLNPVRDGCLTVLCAVTSHGAMRRVRHSEPLTHSMSYAIRETTAYTRSLEFKAQTIA